VTPMNATTKTTPSVVSVAPKTNTSTPAIPQVKAAAPTPAPAPRAPTTASTSYPSASTAINPTTGKSNQQVLDEAKRVLEDSYKNPPSNTSSAPKSDQNKPAVPSAAKTADDKAMKTYQSLMNPSKDELATQEDLDKLIESTKKGYLDTENKVIPMQFITGQLSAMEKRAGVLAEPLQAKLGRLQAARTSSLEASKFALDRADKALAAETASTQPMNVGGNIVKFNPATGEYETVYQGESSKPASVQEYEYAKQNGYTGTFNEYQDEDANRKAIAMGAGGLTTSQQSAAFKLSDDYRAESKDFFTQKSAFNRILSSAQDPSAAGDLALIFNYMKVLDPGSTVREGEFATAQNSGSIPEIIWAKYNKIQSGERLAPDQRADFVDRATKLFNGAQQAQKQIDDTFKSRAEYYGVPYDLILGNTSANNQQVKSLDDYYRSNPAERPKVDQLIRENPNLSDDDILQILNPSFNTAGNATASTAGNRPQRNNNPLNIKASEHTQSYPGVVGVDEKEAEDGGKFLVFDSPEAGFAAAKRLLSVPSYSNLNVDAALRRWSGGGYGAELVPNLQGRTIASLSPTELDNLIRKMAQREGFNA